ncbi:MAG: RNA 3'-terminal phosphate cyclase [Verrucomicrobiia bacterium]
MIEIDGSYGEGGGQLLRTALSLSVISGKPFKIFNIRTKRENPGLQPQHLAAVNAAAKISRAEVNGAQKDSTTLEFFPKGLFPGDYHFEIGTAGSSMLVLQTILPPLIMSGSASNVIIEGGTHNPMAPPYEFVANTYLPQLAKMGANVKVKLDRYGFYPAGGGKIRVVVNPCKLEKEFELIQRGHLIKMRAVSLLSSLPEHIAERELKVLKRQLGLDSDNLQIVKAKSISPANVLFVFAEFANITEVFTGFGRLGVRAEIVAGELAKEVDRYLELSAPVGGHLADQLLLPMAIGKGGRFVTATLSSHSNTNIWIIQQFLPVNIKVEPYDDRRVIVEVKPDDQK